MLHKGRVQSKKCSKTEPKQCLAGEVQDQY